MEIQEIEQFLHALSSVDRQVDDATRIDRIGLLERVKAAASATQATDAVDLDASVREQHSAMGLPKKRHGQGVSVQIALARRESPNKGGRLLGFARAVVQEMPHTFARLQEGELSEWRATILVRETAYLSREHRAEIDRELCSDPAKFAGWGDKRFDTEARSLAYRLDPVAVVERNEYARRERRVSLRPAPDGMAHLGALLPLPQAVACKAALRKAATAIIAQGDTRSRSQIEADLLVERLTGQTTADAVPIRVDLVITDAALFGGDTTPARIPGEGPVPAAVARRLIRRAGEDGQLWLRKLYAHPESGELVAMESKTRLFPAKLAEFIDLRDDLCRTPYCGAPIRHHDHVVPHAEGGATSADNGDGLCESCNYAKQAPGFRAKPSDGDRHTIELTTPTGHTYRSTARMCT